MVFIMKKVFILFIFLLFINNSFANSYDEEIERLKQDIYNIQNRINNIDSRTAFSDIKYNARIFFGINDNDNKSKVNNKIYKGLDKDDYSNFKMNQVRIGMRKNINNKISFNFRIKASDSSFYIYNAYLRYKISNYVSFDLGQMSTIISLENENSGNGSQFANSTRYYTVGNLFFYNGIGFKFNHIYDNFGLYYGLYGNSYNEKTSDYSKVVGIFRTYYNPYKYNNNNLIHLGFSYYFGFVNHKKDLVPLADGSNLFYTISNSNNFIFEFALNYNSFNIQSEFISSFIKPSMKGYDKYFNFYNYYIQTSYLLTGETLNYSEGCFGTVDKVLNPITSGGYGAFEVAFRYSKSDTQDKKSNLIFDYGVYDVYSFAFNWMPIDNAKIIFEYSRVFEKFVDNYITSSINNGVNNNYNVFNLKFKLFF